VLGDDCANKFEELGVESAAVYTELEREALHVKRAKSAYLLGGATPAES
jgi:acetyl-CoA/propionyl-CoA carboxylase biotin carboxyl carrier protein